MLRRNSTKAFEKRNILLKIKNGHIFVLIIFTAFLIQAVCFVFIFSESTVYCIERDLTVQVTSIQKHLKSKCRDAEGFQQSTRNVLNDVTTRPRFCDNCFNNDFQLLLEPKIICKNEAIKLVIFITSLCFQRTDRDVIRQTWLSETKKYNLGVHYFFLLGRPVNDSCSKDILVENEERKDLVSYDFTESYKNLSIKTMLGFKYAAQHCPSARFIMKTDMDVYVNLRAVLTLIDGRKNQENMSKLSSDVRSKPNCVERKNAVINGTNLIPCEMYGLLWKNATPLRNDSLRFKKWHVTFNEYPNSVYPDYLDGHAYILSMNISREVIRISKYIPFFKFEDVYIGLCLQELGYSLRPTQGFLRLGQRITVCSHKFEHVYTVHGVSAERMTRIWNATCPSRGVVQLEYERQNKQWIKVNIDHEIKIANTAQNWNGAMYRKKFHYDKVSRVLNGNNALV